MSKYNLLRLHLSSLKTNKPWTASFKEIENILGQRLPVSARKYQEWWTNFHQPHTRIYNEIGWINKNLDLVHENVTFVYDAEMAKRKATFQKSKSITENKSPIKKALKAELYSWDEPTETSYQLQMKWTAIGKVKLNESQKLQFLTDAPTEPAIYRFIVRHGNSESMYIGETENLKNRLQFYKSPGISQQTNLRINELFKNYLLKGAEISISAVIKEAYINYGQGFRQVELDTKIMRCLFENAALLSMNIDATNILNKVSNKKAVSLPDEN